MKNWSLQHSRFWNYEDVGRRAWRATVHGFARSWTRLSDQTTTARLTVDGSSRLKEAGRGCFMEESRPSAPWSGDEPCRSGQMLSHRSHLPVFLGLDLGWGSVTGDASPERCSWELRPWQGSLGPLHRGLYCDKGLNWSLWPDLLGVRAFLPPQFQPQI